MNERKIETNIGVATNVDYYMKTCFYAIGDKVAIIDESIYSDEFKGKMTGKQLYDVEVRKNCMLGKIIGLEGQFIYCGYGEKYHNKVHHERVVIEYENKKIRSYHPNYMFLIGKLE